MQKCFTKVNNNYYKTLAISELNETKKGKTGGCPKTYLLQLQKF
jgi:hypothetical protein